MRIVPSASRTAPQIDPSAVSDALRNRLALISAAAHAAASRVARRLEARMTLAESSSAVELCPSPSVMAPTRRADPLRTNGPHQPNRPPRVIERATPLLARWNTRHVADDGVVPRNRRRKVFAATMA